MTDRKPGFIFLTDSEFPIQCESIAVNESYVWYVSDDRRGYLPWHRIKEIVTGDDDGGVPNAS